ncbi:MAG: D-glycero-beta-D-manno-heptose 1-phosphate adenylyltransferase [Deltaproteobacteria bacterium]|jgi:D-beta-D-heptose 7-phosphate kinase/D-beta-D-heptose 1-phosphate adenosyltransferase|nr:D-glycero-beta-D-manno-heptose 1-phosphate adenylyltransferase [Deltaproteobacteria bacterium]
MAEYLKKILTLDGAVEARKNLAASGKKMVFTNGCFDLLHPGHLRYLDQARRLGDYLFIGLNSDGSIRRLKGPGRPVRGEGERAEMLAGLTMVDGLTIFNEDTPLSLIVTLRPDFLVKGGDWATQDIVGGKEVLAYGGEVRSLTLEKGFSSTALIERIALAHAQEPGR